VQVYALAATLVLVTPQWMSAQMAAAAAGAPTFPAAGADGDLLVGRRRRALQQEGYDGDGNDDDDDDDDDDAWRGMLEELARGDMEDAALGAHPEASLGAAEAEAWLARAWGAAGGEGEHPEPLVASLPLQRLEALREHGFWREFGSALGHEVLSQLLPRRGGGDGHGRGEAHALHADLADDVLEQLQDVEPLVDAQVTVLLRPLYRTLFGGATARGVSSYGVRAGPQLLLPYAYADPLLLSAADLVPEEAEAYLEAQAEAGVGAGEAARNALAAQTARLAASVLVTFREQVSVNGGDIARRFFVGVV